MGHKRGPLEPPPWELAGWQNRFDDPDRKFRTLYCVEQRLTALREILAPLRRSAKAQAEYKRLFGEDPPPPRVTASWRSMMVLAPGVIKILGEAGLVPIDDLSLRQEFERSHADLLARHAMDHLDIAELRGKSREVTQALTRFVAGRGVAGIVYGSNVDNQPCAALFELRAFLAYAGEPEPLTDSHPALTAVCEELGLVLDWRSREPSTDPGAAAP